MATKKKDTVDVTDYEQDTPTIEQAQAMFAENPGLAHVLTTEGNLSRDGVLVRTAHGE